MKREGEKSCLAVYFAPISNKYNKQASFHFTLYYTLPVFAYYHLFIHIVVVLLLWPRLSAVLVPIVCPSVLIICIKSQILKLFQTQHCNIIML